MGYQDFKEVRVLQEAKSLAVGIYKITSDGKPAKDYGLRDQLQRSSVSIASNMAEGNERNSDAEFNRFLFKISAMTIEKYIPILKTDVIRSAPC